MGPLKEQIYMIDIQIHDIHLETVKELQCLDNEQDFRIYAHFLNFDPVLVYDNQNLDTKALPILFKMNPEELVKAMDRSPMTLSVAGMLNENKEYTVGTVKVFFAESFAEAITLATSSVVYPVVAMVDEVFKFRNLYHEESGDMMVNLKLNCFGDIDIKQLDLCDKDKKESTQEFDNNEDCFNTKEKQLMPVNTDLENTAPATPLTSKYEGIRLPIPWTLDFDHPKEQCDPCENMVDECPPTNFKTPEITLKCTCDSLPEFSVPKAQQTINLKCQCAEILAAMKSCFPNIMPSADQMQPMDMTIPPANDSLYSPIANVSNEHQRSLITEPQQVANDPQRASGVGATPLQQQFPPNEEVVNASSNRPETKYNGQKEISHVQKSSSEERVQVTNKLEVKNVVSNIELNMPEAKIEESSKKNPNFNESTWNERKQIIKKEYKKKRKSPKDIYEYTAGMYPGMVVGHKHCIPVIRLVPRNMGWMWNLLDIFSKTKDFFNEPNCHCRLNPRCIKESHHKTNKGWRPGAILKTVAQNFGSWNKAAGFKEGNDVETFFNFKKKKAATGTKQATHKQIGNKTQKQEETNEITDFKPTLHVHKKDKFYHITMNPPGVDPNVKPITFKVDPRKGSSDEETSSESTSNDSFEFEYTVPAGLIPPPRKIDWATDVTQYDPQDFLPKPKKGELAAPQAEPCKEPAEASPTEQKAPTSDKKGKGGSKKGKGKKKDKKKKK